MNFFTTGTGFQVWFDSTRFAADPRKNVVREWPDEQKRPLFIRCLKMLKRKGFTCDRDRSVHRCIRKDHFLGRLGELEFTAEVHPNLFQVEFFQNVYNVSNPNGGRYDFNKYQRMPYLMRKRVDLMFRVMGDYLLTQGFRNETELRYEDAAREVVRQRNGPGCEHISHYPVQPYNAKDADGVLLKDGDFRHWYDYYGRLRRGRVYHHINNMWWAIASPFEVQNIASFDFFGNWDPSKPLRRVRPSVGILGAFNKAVRESRFKRAGEIATAAAAMTPPIHLKVTKFTTGIEGVK